MSSLTLAPGSVRAERRARAAEAQAQSRARARARAEPLILFLVTATALTALGVRDTAQLHLVYPDALTRLVHVYIAWWNSPPRFRAIGFIYPPLQSVVLLPFALLRPLATSLVALPLFSAVCAGAVIAILDRTLSLLDLGRPVRLLLLAGFALNPLFLDYGANGMAQCLVMALLAAGLYHFCAWYVHGADSIRSLGFCGGWLAIAFLARYETALWLALIMLAVLLVRWRARARLIEIIALEAILAAPIVYIFLIWSGVSSLLGGGGFLSWITRAGAEHLTGLDFDGRVGFGHRAAGIIEVLWRSSPLLLVVPALLGLAALLMRRPVLLALAASVVIGAAASVLRMAVRANPELLQPQYQMIALIPMLIGAGWLISLAPRGGSGPARAYRAVTTLALGAGLVASLFTAYDLMRHDANPYDHAFTTALSSHLQRTIPAHGASAADRRAADVYADDQAVATFFEAAVYSHKTVLVDELAFPGLILAQDSTAPYRTRAENGSGFWDRLLDHPFRQGKLRYLLVANPQRPVPGYPVDRISERYPGAYSGHLAHSQVIYRDPLIAVVQLLPARAGARAAAPSLLPSSRRRLLQLYQDLPELSRHDHFTQRG